VQNLVVRDYAARHDMLYLLSATEYAMPSCYLMLSAILGELPTLGGIILFSLFMLPRRKSRRLEIYERFFESGRELHAALENVSLKSPEDRGDIEDVLDVAFTLPNLPLRGRYEKDDDSAALRLRDPFWSVLSVSP
jgi:sporadic carbohydrate cluster protein (TIGR04323 family)